MTVEEFFVATAEYAKKCPGNRIHLDISPDAEDGWCVKSAGKVAYGDTVQEAIQAVYDHVMGKPSQFCTRRKVGRLDPPEGRVVGYDYRVAKRVATEEL